jgi:putative transcriptional regulator
VLVAAAVLKVAAPATAQAPIAGSLAGQLLVAAPSIDDPRFAHTVILMIRHDKDGALGLVINRLLEERPLADLLARLGEKDAAATGTVRVFTGGPVQPDVGFVIHDKDYHGSGTVAVNEHIAVTANPEVLIDIGRGKGPSQSMIVLGYAGWGAGQLESEFRRRDWVVAPGEPKLVFEADRDKLWDLAFAQRMQDL